jgi:ABC-type uncharacterized transport system auxiliary subunit
MSRRTAFAAAATTALLAAGCALTQKAKPLDVSYYTPERVWPGVMNAQAGEGPALRFGRVGSGIDLGERIVHRDGAHRVVYDGEHRWTERPEVYVRRSLAHALFEAAGFRRAVSGEAPTIEVDVLSFEEVAAPAQHAAHIELHVVLSTDHALLEETLSASEPVAGAGFDAFAEAMARALDRVSNDVVRRVGPALVAQGER